MQTQRLAPPTLTGLVMVLAVVAGCSSDSNGGSTNDGASGGTSTGGGTSGGTGTGSGGTTDMGGSRAGGAPANGGSDGATGGASDAGSSGMDTGGASAGGTDTGGASAGGTNTGGTSAGGTNTGGTDTGGAGTGGAGGTGALCGGIACAADQECCGPAECGYCINPLTDPACASSCPRRACGDQGLECLDPILGYPGEICVATTRSVGPSEVTSYKCERNPCGLSSGTVLSCACASAACADGTVPGPTCTGANDSTLTLSCNDGAAVCAAPDTPIATPEGDRPIASLRAGDLVYSVDHDAVVVVPLVEVAHRDVVGHHVVRVETEGGVVLEISPGHPTADGRTFGDLRAHDSLDGSVIATAALVPYPHESTFDILPASSTGTYYAGGLLIGSTLKH